MTLPPTSLALSSSFLFPRPSYIVILCSILLTCHVFSLPVLPTSSAFPLHLIYIFLLLFPPNAPPFPSLLPSNCSSFPLLSSNCSTFPILSPLQMTHLSPSFFPSTGPPFSSLLHLPPPHPPSASHTLIQMDNQCPGSV